MISDFKSKQAGGEGDLAVMIPFDRYRKLQSFLRAIGTELKTPDQLTIDGYIRGLNL